MFNRKIISTADGSTTIFIPEWNESYHSRHGAIQEAYHVFIAHGLDLIRENKKTVSVLEIGFGTGLNALITLLESAEKKLNIHYTGIEKYPVSPEETTLLNYPESLQAFNPEIGFSQIEIDELYRKIMSADWNELKAVNPTFSLKKIQADFLDYDYPKQEFDLIYFDAFGARVQPELWTETLFEKLFKSLKSNGILTTYSAKGSVRRALSSVGFQVEKRPGPPGKREMLTAIK